MTVATKTLVQEPLFTYAPSPELLAEYEALLAESWPERSWGCVLTVEIVGDRLELPRGTFRACVELWGWPSLPVRCR